MNRFWQVTMAILVPALIVLALAPAVVLACMPMENGMVAAPVVDVTQELPGGG